MPIETKTENGKTLYRWGKHGAWFVDRKKAEAQAAAAYANGYAGDGAIAFDRSMRSFDTDGRLHVELTNISKAMVCPYMASEIPGAKEMGLDQDKIYYLLRAPEELKKAAPTFNNIPVLIKHEPVNAEDSKRDLIVGTTGSDAVFNAPYLQCSLAIWDQEGIDGVENKERQELSSAYHYRADMTPGNFEGIPYDGVMRDIIGNHVALVDTGRAGHDVVVADKNPFMDEENMKKNEAKEKILQALGASKGVIIAQDADLQQLDNVIDALIGIKDGPEDKEPEATDELDENDENNDEFWEDDPDNPGKRRRKKPVMPEGGTVGDEDEEGDKEDMIPQPAMDAAIRKASRDIEQRTVKRMEALFTARKEVSSLVGDVALDSAEAVYKFALDQAKIPTAGVHPSAYRALVQMHKKHQDETARRGTAASVAMDAQSVKDINEQFPELKRFKRA